MAPPQVVTDDERADVRFYIMHNLRRAYPHVPEGSRRTCADAFESKAFRRATSVPDYLDKISRGIVRVDHTPLSSSPRVSPPPSKRARISPPPSPLTTSCAEQQPQRHVDGDGDGMSMRGVCTRGGGVRDGGRERADAEGWRAALADGDRERRVALVRAEAGKFSAWMTEERLMEEARTIESTAFRVAKSLVQYDEMLCACVGRVEEAGRSWRERVKAQKRAAMCLLMMSRLRAKIPDVDEKMLIKVVESFEDVAWRTESTEKEYCAMIEKALKIAEHWVKKKAGAMGREGDHAGDDDSDGGGSEAAVGGEQQLAGGDGGVLADGHASEEELPEGDKEGNEGGDEERDYSWSGLEEDDGVSGMGANSLIISSSDEDVFDMDYVAEPRWNLDVTESQIVA